MAVARNKKRRVKLLAIMLGVVLLPLFFIYLGTYQVTYLDYHTGMIRVNHMGGIAGESVTYEETWITTFVSSNQIPDWHIIGRRKQKLVAVEMNTKARRVLFEIIQFGEYLKMVNADQSTHQSVAEFIIREINQSDGNDQSAFGIALNTFECFFDSAPWPESDEGSITQDQILQLIENCSNP